jgi:hypothetical protein
MTTSSRAGQSKDGHAEMMKGINPNSVVNPTQALHWLFDGLVALN